MKEYRKTGWREAVASSGAAKSIAAVLAANGWSERGIELGELDRFREKLIKAGDLERLELPGLRDDR